MLTSYQVLDRNMFYVVDTIGLPLEILLLEVRDAGFVVAWDVFVDEAIAGGWLMSTIRRKIREGVMLAYGEEYLKEFSWRLDLLLRSRMPC